MTRANHGCVRELQVCIDLASKGYEVFKAVLTNTQCDVVAVKGDTVLRLEVRGGRIDRYKRVVPFPEVKASRTGYDLLAIVHLEKVFYMDKQYIPVPI